MAHRIKNADYNQQDIDRYLDGYFEQVTDWKKFTFSHPGTPKEGTPLFTEDSSFPGSYLPSYLLWQGILVALDTLEGALILARPPVCSPSKMHAIPILCRTALISAAQSLWAMPEDPDLRRQRTLQLSYNIHQKELQSLSERRQVPGLRDHSPSTDRQMKKLIAKLDPDAKTIKRLMEDAKILTKFPDTFNDIISPMAQQIFADSDVLARATKTLWRLGSALAHGQVHLSAPACIDEVIRLDQGLAVRRTADREAHLLFCFVAFEFVHEALQRWGTLADGFDPTLGIRDPGMPAV